MTKVRAMSYVVLLALASPATAHADVIGADGVFLEMMFCGLLVAVPITVALVAFIVSTRKREP